MFITAGPGIVQSQIAITYSVLVFGQDVVDSTLPDVCPIADGFKLVAGQLNKVQLRGWSFVQKGSK